MLSRTKMTLVIAAGLMVLSLTACPVLAQDADTSPAAQPAAGPAPQALPPGAIPIPAGMDPAVAIQKMSQQKLMTMRAARMDAMRKIAEHIKGLRISSTTTVRDFVAENDQINAGLDTFIKGIKEARPARFFADGTCELDMEVKLVTVVQEIKSLHNRYYKGDKVKSTDIENIVNTTKETMIYETGSGAPGGQALVVAGPGPAPVAGGIPPIWTDLCTAQGRLMAVRAARVDSIRKLAERVKGLRINSNTTVRDFVAQSDEIRTSLDTYLNTSGRERGVVYHTDELIVDVTTEMTLRTVYEEIKSLHSRYYKGDKIKSTDFDEVIRTAKDTPITEIGSGVPPERYLKTAAAPQPAPAAAAPASARPQWPAKITATGQAAVDTANENIAQAKLLAMRGAELDARRKLSERIDGLRISSSTTVKDFVAQNDEIQTDMDTFQQGVRVVNAEVKNDGTAEATVELTTDRLWSIVNFWQKKMDLKVK